MRRLGSSEVLALAGVLSFCSLVYELAIAASFVGLTGDAPFWQGLTIGLYLAALGAGTWSCSRLAVRDSWAWLWGVELALTAAGALSASGILSLDTALRVYRHFYAGASPSPWAAMAALASGHLFTLLIGWLSGFELPLLLRLARDSDGRDRTREVLGVNYFGALAGSLAFSFWLYPALGAAGSATAASGLNLAACAFLYRRAPAARDDVRTGGLVTAAAVWAALFLLSPHLARLNAAAFHSVRIGAARSCSTADAGLGRILRELLQRSEAVERIPSAYQRIELVTEDDPAPLDRDPFNFRPRAEPDLPYKFRLFLDRRPQFYGAREAVYHEFLGHVPVQLFNRVPEDVLILGGGDGLLAKELLKYGARVRSIVNVELDPAMTRLAAVDPRFRLLNRDSFRDPKVEVVVGDAFSFLRRDARLFDAVFIDLPMPNTYDLAKLYSAEFFRNVARRLKPGGFGAMGYPLASSAAIERTQDRESLRRNTIAVSTLRAGGFTTIVPFDTECPELVLYDDAVRWGIAEMPEDEDPLTARMLRGVLARRFLSAHPGLTADPKEDYLVLSNRDRRNSMLAFTRDRVRADFRFKDHGIPLYSLNPNRLRVLEDGRFPYKEDPSLANSVARPTLLGSLSLPE